MHVAHANQLIMLYGIKYNVFLITTFIKVSSVNNGKLTLHTSCITLLIMA